MTRSDYKKKRKELQAKYQNELIALAELYATENNPVKIGDVIFDGTRTIKVSSMEVESKLFSYPTMKYFGTKLMKNGKPYKRSLDKWTFQNCLISINGEPAHARGRNIKRSDTLSS